MGLKKQLNRHSSKECRQYLSTTERIERTQTERMRRHEKSLTRDANK